MGDVTFLREIVYGEKILGWNDKDVGPGSHSSFAANWLCDPGQAVPLSVLCPHAPRGTCSVATLQRVTAAAPHACSVSHAQGPGEHRGR